MCLGHLSVPKCSFGSGVLLSLKFRPDLIFIKVWLKKNKGRERGKMLLTVCENNFFLYFKEPADLI